MNDFFKELNNSSDLYVKNLHKDVKIDKKHNNNNNRIVDSEKKFIDYIGDNGDVLRITGGSNDY